MNPAIYIAIFLPLLIMLLQQKQNNTALLMLRHKRKGARSDMKDLARHFIGKDCLVYTFNGTQLSGVIKEVTENALLMDNKGSPEAINLDFIVRIREYPTNKKGKRASIITD